MQRDPAVTWCATSTTRYGFEPRVERVDDANLRVTYRYPLEGDANAAPQGQAVSEFYYDEESGSVVHTGEFPPE
ncbi:LppP/LprE family lipoprotein [Kocuria rhizophila]